MQFGVHYSLGVGFNPTAENYVRVAQRAEALGYHSLWLADHIVVPETIAAPYPWTEDGSVGFPRNAPFPDPFVLLSYIAAKTQKILLGTSVLIVPYRGISGDSILHFLFLPFCQPPFLGRKLVPINRSSFSTKSAAPKGRPVRKCNS